MNDKQSFLIVFDVDGTLFDTKPGIIMAINYVLSCLGEKKLSIAQEDQFIGPPVKQSFKKHFQMNDERAEIATKKYRQIYVEKFVEQSRPYKDIEKMLHFLKKRKIKLAIATMKTLKQMERLLELFNYKHYFSFLETAADDGNKTKEDMLLSIKEKNKNNISKFIMVGDTEGDEKAAVIAGYIFVAAEYGYGSFKNNKSKFHIKSPSELLEIIEKF